MMTGVIICGFLYLVLLFLIANLAERQKNKQWLQHPWIHTLGLAVFCTTWTYYGSVGRAATNGIDFLAIYLGPTIILALGYGMQRKIFNISKELHITSLADLISVRFGKNFTLGVLITVCSIIALVPYIGLQLKAIVSSLEVFIQADHLSHAPSNNIFVLIAICTAIVLCVFSILYGARKLEPSESHPGLMAVIAFESLFKLIIFFIIGFFITFIINDGYADIISKLSSQRSISHLFTIEESSGYSVWIAMMILSAFAFLLLPRQFHVTYIENAKLANIKFSSWSLPLYLVVINLFIIPIAYCGMYLFNAQDINADMYVLAIPLELNQNVLAILSWLGGLSAATGMIIIETIALSIMVSNNIVTPLFYATNTAKKNAPIIHKNQILYIRRLSIIGVITLALAYDIFLGKQNSLVSIGLISFGGLVNFAPVLLFSLYWKNITSAGAISGVIVGFLVWFLTSVIPQAAYNGFISNDIMDYGLFGCGILKPNALFGLEILDPLSHSLFWSLFLNIFVTVFISLITHRTRFEVYYAELFVDNDRFDQGMGYEVAWKGSARLKDLYALLGNFIGTVKARKMIQEYAESQSISTDMNQPAHTKLVVFTERILGGVIGAAPARILMKRSTEEEEISYKEMYHIIKENQSIKANNRLLKIQSKELKETTTLLKVANENLQKADEQKNEFLYTVTHELKTPLTSIIALSEIVNDNPDLEKEERALYLGSVIKEANRLSHLINQVLKLEKFEAGKLRLNLQQVDLGALIKESVTTFEGTARNKNLNIKLHLTNAMILVSCDYDMITQVLVNLIGNAVKFAQNTIQIKTFELPGYWEVWVSDDGRGIPQSDREYIFDKFFQAKNQHIKKPEGSGLGLAICKKIIDLHNGTIRVDTSQAAGAHLVFTLPKDELDLF